MPELITGKNLIFSIKAKCEEYREVISGKKVVLIEFTSISNTNNDRLLIAKISADSKARHLQSVGFDVLRLQLSFENDEVRLGFIINQANNDETILGVIIQVPIPKYALPLVANLDDQKDIDGVKPCNSVFSAMAVVESALRLVESLNNPNGSVAVVGSRGLIGSSISEMLLQKGFVCVPIDIGDDLERVQIADIVVSATGSPCLLDCKHLSVEHSLVIDIGFSRLVGNSSVRFLGDINPTAYCFMQRITPVPGGMGPIQVATLIERLLRLLNIKSKWSYSYINSTFLVSDK